MDTPHFFIHLLADGHLGCFHFLAIMNNAIMNISVQIFLQKYVFLILLDIYLGVESTGSYSNSMFNFLMNCQTMAMPILSQQQERNLLFKPVFFGVLMCIQLGLVINGTLGHQVFSVL